MAILKKLKDTLKEVATLGQADTQTYNPNEVVRNTLEQSQGVSMARREKPYNPDRLDPYTTGKKDTFGKTSAYYTPAIENKLLGDKSTVSRARLDIISPVITTKIDNARDEKKNVDLYRDLKTKGAITPEDDQELLDMKNQGMSKSDAAAKLIAKKRYQIGTRQSAPRTINATNYTDIFNKSEVQQYLDEKIKNADPEVIGYMKKVSEEKGGKQARGEIFQQFIEKDIEDEAYNNKSFIEKSAENVLKTAGVTGLALANDIILRLPAFALDITGQKGGDILNALADKNIKKGAEFMGVNTGGVKGEDNTLMAGKIIATILPFLTPKGWIQAGAGAVGKIPTLSKFPQFVKEISGITKAIEGGKNLKKLRWLGASAIRNGLFSVGGHALYEGKAPSLTQGGLETGIGIAADMAIPGLGKTLKYLGAKAGVTGLLKFGARKRLARELAEEGEVGAIDDIYKWLDDRKQNYGNEEDMVASLSQYTEDSYKATNDITKKMDEAGVRIQDNGYISGSLKKIHKKLSGSESPEQIAKLSRVDELLAKVEKEGSLLPSEANEVKRLLDENLDMFTMDGFVKKPQMDNVKLRSGVREAIEKEGDKLGFDVRAMNAETSVSRKIRDGIVDKMLSDNLVERAALFTGKNIIRGALGGVVGPFEDWRANALFGMVGGLVAKPIIENQRFKNWLARTLTAFTKKEAGALEQFLRNGKTTPQAEEAILRFTEKMRAEQKAVYDEIIKNRKLLPPPSGKPLSPNSVDVTPQTGYSPGVMDKNNEALYGTNQKSIVPADQIPKSIIESLQPKPEIPVKTTKLLSSLGKPKKEGVGVSDIPSKKVNNPIIQKLAKKQETPKTPQVEANDFYKERLAINKKKLEDTNKRLQELNDSTDTTLQGQRNNFAEKRTLEIDKKMLEDSIKNFEETLGKSPQVEGKTVEPKITDVYEKSGMTPEMASIARNLDESFGLDISKSDYVDEYVSQKLGKKFSYTSAMEGRYTPQIETAIKEARDIYSKFRAKKSSLPLSSKSEVKYSEYNPPTKAKISNIFKKNGFTLSETRKGRRGTEYTGGVKIDVIKKDVKYGKDWVEEPTGKVKITSQKKYHVTGSQEVHSLDSVKELLDKQGIEYIDNGESLTVDLLAMESKKSSLPLSSKSEVKYSKPDTLVQEAKKYKSADDFMKAQEGSMYFHGTNVDFKKPDVSKVGTGEGSIMAGKGFNLTSLSSDAKNYAYQVSQKKGGKEVILGTKIDKNKMNLFDADKMDKDVKMQSEIIDFILKKQNEFKGLTKDKIIGKLDDKWTGDFMGLIEEEYGFAKYVDDFIKSKGFDGVITKERTSQKWGKIRPENITIFNPKDIEMVNLIDIYNKANKK